MDVFVVPKKKTQNKKRQASEVTMPVPSHTVKWGAPSDVLRMMWE